MGLNVTIDMTWGRLILLSFSKKRAKNVFQAKVHPVHSTTFDSYRYKMR